jgi:hypothetical protein
MWKLFTVVFIFWVIGETLNASSLEIIKDGKSEYQIVISENNNKQLMKYYVKAGKLLQKCIMRSTRVKLPLILAKYNENIPTIFIGKNPPETSIKSFGIWQYIIKVSSGNIYLKGYDSPRFAGERSNSYGKNYLGTVKAVLEFLKKYCGVSFVLPGSDGIVVEKRKEIAIPDDVFICKKPDFEYCRGRSKELYYDLANNFFPSISYGTYGGHSHDRAIPQKKYYNQHPEYFALINGKRFKYAKKPQYCLSNKNVQELIYKEILNHADQGYKWVQLGQSDSFRGCECSKCINLYGIKARYSGKKARNDPAWREKIWIMHLNMAKRFAKERPNKKIVIMSYSPTRNPPRSLKKFPENVIVELCSYSEKSFDNWKKVEVPSGFVTYVYNWGYYQQEGFSPKITPEFCKKQIKLFRNNHVRGIYRCGFGELFGLEGPVYYIYGELLGNPNVSVKETLNYYCKAAFGKGGKYMLKFYNLLYKRVNIKLENNRIEWGTDDESLSLEYDSKYNNIKLLFLRYPHNIMEKLNGYLEKAEKTVYEKKVKLRMKLVRVEFDYLRKTSRIAELFVRYMGNPSFGILKSIKKKVDQRKTFIKSLPRNKTHTIGYIGTLPLFGCVNIKTLIAGGRNRAVLNGPFQWNLDFYLKHKTLPSKDNKTAISVK